MPVAPKTNTFISLPRIPGQVAPNMLPGLPNIDFDADIQAK